MKLLNFASMLARACAVVLFLATAVFSQGNIDAGENKNVSPQAVTASQDGSGGQVARSQGPQAPVIKRGKEEMVNDLKTGERGKRLRAAEELGKLRDKNAVPALTEALKDEDQHVRGEAAEALGKTGNPSVLKPLLEAVKSEDDNTRWGAIQGLADLGDKKAVDALIGLLSHGDRNTRWKAATALGGLEDKKAVNALVKALQNDSDPFVRKGVIEALVKIGDKKAVNALVKAKSDKDETVRAYAAKALEMLK